MTTNPEPSPTPVEVTRLLCLDGLVWTVSIERVGYRETAHWRSAPCPGCANCQHVEEQEDKR